MKLNLSKIVALPLGLGVVLFLALVAYNITETIAVGGGTFEFYTSGAIFLCFGCSLLLLTVSLFKE